MSCYTHSKRLVLLLGVLGVGLSSASSKGAPSTGDTVGKDDGLELELQDAWGDGWWPWAGGAATRPLAGEAKDEKKSAFGVGLSSASSKEAPSTGDTVDKDDGLELEHAPPIHISCNMKPPVRPAYHSAASRHDGTAGENH